MSTYKLSTQELAERLSKSFQDKLENEIREHLSKNAQKIIAEMAKEIAERLKVHISGYESMADRSVQVMVSIDGVKDLAPDNSQAG